MIHRLEDQVEEPIVYIADRRLYVNADRSRLVNEGDSDAYYLLVAEGGGLSDAVAKQYGLTGSPKPEAVEEPDPKPEAKAVKAAPEDKSVKGPAGTK